MLTSLPFLAAPPSKAASVFYFAGCGAGRVPRRWGFGQAAARSPGCRCCLRGGFCLFTAPATYLSLTSHCHSLPCHCLFLTFQCLSLTSHCHPLPSHCLSLTFHCLSLTSHCPSLPVHCPSLTSHCVLQVVVATIPAAAGFTLPARLLAGGSCAEPATAGGGGKCLTVVLDAAYVHGGGETELVEQAVRCSCKVSPAWCVCLFCGEHKPPANMMARTTSDGGAVRLPGAVGARVAAGAGHAAGGLSLPVRCLSLTFPPPFLDLPLLFHCLALTFHRLSTTFPCLALRFRDFPLPFHYLGR